MGAFSSMWRNAGLAEWDRHLTGQLSEATERSLCDIFERQSESGAFVSHGEVFRRFRSSSKTFPIVKSPESDPYITALAIELMRQNNVPVSDPRNQHGLMAG